MSQIKSDFNKYIKEISKNSMREKWNEKKKINKETTLEWENYQVGNEKLYVSSIKIE